MDAGFLAELRTWAGNAEGMLLARWVNSGERDDTAIVTARLFGELAAKMDARLAAERRRLVSAVVAAEITVMAAAAALIAANDAFAAAGNTDWGEHAASANIVYGRHLEAAKRAARDADRDLDAPRRALDDFDVATKGGER